MLINWCKKMGQIAWRQETPILECEAVKNAVSDFMGVMQDSSGIKVLYDKRTEELVYYDGNEMLPMRLLSSGFRDLLGVVFDIAYRMAVLNSDLLGNIPKETPGIVLVDEIDLHLHPNWQWRVAGACFRVHIPVRRQAGKTYD